MATTKQNENRNDNEQKQKYTLWNYPIWRQMKQVATETRKTIEETVQEAQQYQMNGQWLYSDTILSN